MGKYLTKNKNIYTIWYIKENDVYQLEFITILANNPKDAEENFKKCCNYEIASITNH